MADPPRRPAGTDDTGVGESITGMPRWAKVLGIVAMVVLLLYLILMFTPVGLGGGGHGSGSGGHALVNSQEQKAGPDDGGGYDPLPGGHW